MDPRSLWRGFLEGGSPVVSAFLMAMITFVTSLIVIIALLRPIVLLISSREPEKIRRNRLRRVGFALYVATFALGLWVFLHAVYPRGTRHEQLIYSVTEFSLVLFVGYGLFEILLTLFADYIPQVRGVTPPTPIFKDITRTILLLAIFLLAVKLAFPRADIGAVLTTSAILSLVVGLALQESLSNIFSGIMLSVEQPFKPGDWLEIEGREGKVLDSNWRSTRILTRDDDVIYVPNSVMAKQTIVNLSSPTPLHLCRRTIQVEFGAQPNKVRAVLTNMMLRVEGVLNNPPPDVFVIDYADSGVSYALRFWIEDHARRTRIEAEVMRSVWYHLKRNGIAIPFPVRDIIVRRPKRDDHQTPDLLALLSRVDIFTSLTEAEVKLLADDLTTHLYARGELICRQGDAGSTFYIIKSGLISVQARVSDGNDAEVAQLKPGNYFGEMSLLTGEPRSSTCKALEDSELLCLNRESFSVLLEENSAVAQMMSEVLASRTQATQRKLAEKHATLIRPSGTMEETKSHILERIWQMFRFRG